MPSRKRRASAPKPETRCTCGEALERFWAFCPDCGRTQTWGDTGNETGAECFQCGWIVSDYYTFCPWCGADIHEEGVSAEEPMKAPRGFRFTARCDAGCGGGVQYPMPFCPWCGEEQEWPDDRFEGTCPHCERGVNDWMHVCPWCGNDATGQDLIPQALQRVHELLRTAGITRWGFRILLRPGVSGVDPKYPKIVEIDQAYVTDVGSRDEIPWPTLVGLICHELGHSFLFHHWRWTRRPEFRAAFGEVDKAYRVSDDGWVDFQRRRVSTTYADFVSTYAKRHPQEDFAETFRFYVTRRGRMRELLAEMGQKRKAVSVYEKFLVLHKYVRELRSRR